MKIVGIAGLILGIFIIVLLSLFIICAMIISKDK